MMRTPDERFASHVRREGAHLMWTGAVGGAGYGNFRVGRGRYAAAHRFAWEAANGPIGPRQRLTKTDDCDRLLCIDPAHWRIEGESDET